MIRLRLLQDSQRAPGEGERPLGKRQSLLMGRLFVQVVPCLCSVPGGCARFFLKPAMRLAEIEPVLFCLVGQQIGKEMAR